MVQFRKLGLQLLHLQAHRPEQLFPLAVVQLLQRRGPQAQALVGHLLGRVVALPAVGWGVGGALEKERVSWSSGGMDGPWLAERKM